MKDDRVFLAHVRDAISKIELYTEGGREAFLADTKTQDARTPACNIGILSLEGSRCGGTG